MPTNVQTFVHHEGVANRDVEPSGDEVWEQRGDDCSDLFAWLDAPSSEPKHRRSVLLTRFPAGQSPIGPVGESVFGLVSTRQRVLASTLWRADKTQVDAKGERRNRLHETQAFTLYPNVS